MYLIQYSKNSFINAETIERIWSVSEGIRFQCTGNPEGLYCVDKELEASFLNHLSAVNRNELSGLG